jgi:secreted protein with Ig-like and vWFA domain
MNQDDNSSGQIDPELEARVTAWVLGELPDREAAELARQVAENPRLAECKRRIEAVHRLVREAARPAPATMRLSAERRAKLLAAIAPDAAMGREPRAEPAAPAVLSAPARKKPYPWSQWLLPAAACIALCVLGRALMTPAFQKASLQERALRRAEGADYRVTESGEKKKEEIGREAEIPTVGTAAQLPVSAGADGGAGGPIVVQNIAGARALNYANPPAQPPAPWAGTGGRGRVDSDKIAAVQADNARAAQTPLASSSGAKTAGEVVTLNPFEVDASKDIGYYAENTLAGSRLRTNIGDLAASITVVTKQQLEDTGALNVNDVFLSEANSENPANRIGGGQAGFTGGVATTGGNAPQGVKNVPAASPRDVPAPADAPVIRVPGRASTEESVRAEVSTKVQAVSTFSLHVSDASFRLARAALARGERPDPASIRPEEFYNAFDYGDPSAAPNEAVACRIEQAAHPFLQQRNLVRIALKVPATGRPADQPLRLTVLLDTSGSMEREDRLATARQAMTKLVSLLGPADRITLIGFARQPRLLADHVPGDQAAKLPDIVGRTPAEGGTNLEEALKLAGESARGQFAAGAQNRIVVLTDGAANLGSDQPEALAAQVAALRQEGIAFDACGVGTDGLDDTVLEALTRKGDGRYYVVNSPDEADDGFARRLAGAFRPAAQNAKVQVRFNPARVRSYRLIGFEQQRLAEADFRNDQVAAAALAAEEAAVALYQVEVLPEGEGELGEVSVRFRNAATGEMVERSWTLPHAAQVPAFDRATPSLQLAGCAALLAEKLRGGAPAASIRLGTLAPAVDALRARAAHDARVQELATMFAQARRLVGE